ncbi:adaptor protein MecA [Mesobacillus subterraneus]|uniref:adaptor protein MecA n=1 Tax=Mesobacillus subterraneus TaxID=285983 RepID=UPI001CFCF90D|nr:adaptor protein MecA [Mesobacillus subterraneus]WLR53826.1 adaptor protein MecA [Mesobacillus subterraneus]
MEIERINENTVKFYISYMDIEERGFDREEIWYNRDRSEELFWEMMDEVHAEEEFAVEGPLWIQVQALEKGLEVLVTKAQLSKDGPKFELPLPNDKLKDLPVDERIEELLDHQFNPKGIDDADPAFEDDLEFLLYFKDFEDVISLSKRSGIDKVKTSFYSYDDKYYLYIEFPEHDFEDEEEIDNILSVLLEYGQESSVTIHRLDEYGNKIIDDDVFSVIRKHFT